jgi:hypothetical protein
MKAKRVFDKTCAGLSGQGDGAVLTVKAQYLVCRMPHEQRQLMLQSPAVVTSSHIDARAGIGIDVREIKKEFQHPPVIEIEVKLERGAAEISL